MKIIKRLLDINIPAGKSAFLWGPRKVGKTYYINNHLKINNFKLIDLLKTDVFSEYAIRPSLIRERYQDCKDVIIIDEIQKVPQLLDEIHWLIENKKLSFILTGSSARKLRRGHANLLAGRAWRYNMVPLSCFEIDEIDIERIMISGMLPPHYLSPDPIRDLRGYVYDYLAEEIISEALILNIPAFYEFLRIAAITNSELINYVNVGRESGVSHKVVRQYFQILEDTYLGFRIKPWKKNKNRRMIQTEKFYFFDIGVANYLARRQPKYGSLEFGKSFEHFILMELKAYQSYHNPDIPITFWRTSTGQEVDFIIGDMDIAVEIKGTERIHKGHTKGIKSLLNDFSPRHSVIVCLEKIPRKIEENIEVLPWQLFLERLWSGDFGI